MAIHMFAIIRVNSYIIYKHCNDDVKGNKLYTGKNFALDYLKALTSHAAVYYSNYDVESNTRSNGRRGVTHLSLAHHLNNPQSFHMPTSFHELVTHFFDAIFLVPTSNPKNHDTSAKRLK